MTVVPIAAPRLQNTVDKALVPRPADMINDLVPPILDQCGAYLCGNVIKHLVPGDTLPFTITTLPFPPHRVKNAVDVVDLVARRWPFCAISATAARMIRIALKFPHPHRLFIDLA